jgi:hypothetical protein
VVEVLALIQSAIHSSILLFQIKSLKRQFVYFTQITRRTWQPPDKIYKYSIFETMAITEIVTPFLKNTAASRKLFETEIGPGLLSLLSTAPGMIKQFFGPMVTEEKANVEADVKYALGFG